MSEEEERKGGTEQKMRGTGLEEGVEREREKEKREGGREEEKEGGGGWCDKAPTCCLSGPGTHVNYQHHGHAQQRQCPQAAPRRCPHRGKHPFKTMLIN